MGNSPSMYEKFRASALADSGEPIVTVSIGGNSLHRPMSDTTWARYRKSLREALDLTVGPVAFATLGQSTWQGVSERSYVASVLRPNLDNLDVLRTRLRSLADAYGQDAIALTVGKSALLAPLSVSTSKRRAA